MAAISTAATTLGTIGASSRTPAFFVFRGRERDAP